MADRIVYLGPYNNTKSNQLFNRAIDYLKQGKGNKFYYILPNGILLEDYRRRIIEKVGGAFDINLFTFDDIVDRLLEDEFYIFIDANTKEILLYQIISRLNQYNKLNFYRNISNKRGFIYSLIRIIGEIKRSLVTVDMYLERCPKDPFYTEIGLIYDEYEKELNSHGFIDREESFFKSLKLLKGNNSFFNDLDFIIIDGFFDFRPQEMELLREMSRADCPIFINMPFDRNDNFKTLLETIEFLEDLGYRVEREEEGKLTYYEKLANNLFSSVKGQLKPNSNIHVLKAADNYLELKKIVEIIKGHILEGAQLKDMAVVLLNPSEYKDKLFKVFEEEKIPCSLNKEIKLIQLPLIKELTYIFQVKENTKKSIINRIKSNYFSLCNTEERDKLEYYLRKLAFKSLEDLMERTGSNTKFHMPNLDFILKTLEEEFNLIPAKASINDYTLILMDFIKKYNIEEKILHIYNEIKDFKLFYRDISAINRLKDILNKISSLNKIIKEEITFRDYINLLSNYLDEESVIETMGNRNGINILSPVTIRGKKYRVLFLVGLSQGNYPNLIEENFFFKEDNYLKLKEIGLDIKNYHERLDKESILFTTAIAACGENLYLSYSENATEDEKDIPSMFLDEILNAIEGDKSEEKVDLITVDIDYLIKNNHNELTTKRELLQYILEKYALSQYEGESLSISTDLDKNVFSEIDDKITCEIERNTKKFSKYSGNINDEQIIEDIKNIHKGKIFSISYLESYGKCPYYFLLNNLLNVEEMEREFGDFTSLDRGKINHEVLKVYYYNYEDQIRKYILGVETFDPEETYDFILNKIKENMNQLGVDLNSKLWQLRIENNASRILEFIKSDLDRLSKMKKKLIPIGYEIDFGRREPFEIEIDDVKIPFTGVIDRLDKYVDEDKYIIIDYKNSSYSIKNIEDMISGTSLQLPIYILSQKSKIVGALYGIISTGEFQVKIGIVDEKDLINKKNKGALTEEELDELLNITKDFIRFYIESIHKGNFSVDPKECLPYCIYKNICRFKPKISLLQD
ncbi:PD-(D/E)XK nuclease family protein [Tepidimicrobium xylanilyticum]